MFAPRFAASRICAMAAAKFASGSGPMRICTRPTVYLRAFSLLLLILLGLHWAMQQGQPRQAELASNLLHTRHAYSSRISTAAAMVVVHLPRLSPTADWVMLLVRTILLEMR